MKDALNYLKFDFRIVKKSMKYYALVIPIFYFMFMFSKEYTFAISYMNFFLIIVATIPFSIQSNEKSTEMYYMFPSKISSMVIGRFFYLICSMLAIFTICSITTKYLYWSNKIDYLNIVTILFTGVISIIICFIQYPIYYKVGLEKGKIISMLIYFLPAFFVLSLPKFLLEHNLYIYLSFSSITMLLAFGGLIVVVIAYISYLSSLKICREKEI